MPTPNRLFAALYEGNMASGKSAIPLGAKMGYAVLGRLVFLSLNSLVAAIANRHISENMCALI